MKYSITFESLIAVPFQCTAAPDCYARTCRVEREDGGMRSELAFDVNARLFATVTALRTSQAGPFERLPDEASAT